MVDSRVVKAVRKLAREHKTPDVVVEALLAKMLPAIRLVPQAADDLPLGASRIGGCPDLPARMIWPRLSEAAGEDASAWEPDINSRLQFVLQVNLAETAPFDVADVLPKTGLLSFFFYWDRGEWDSEEAFIVHTKNVDRLTRKKWPRDLPEGQRYRPLRLVPQLEWTMPSIADAGLGPDIFNPDRPLSFAHYDFWEAAEEWVAQVQGLQPANSGDGVAHRLLGHPKLIQTPGLADGTRLLLQADSDPPRHRCPDFPRTGMMWGDCGRLYYLVSDEELQDRRLAEKPYVLVQMC
jgi:uncharacterized protein YwqG